MTIPPLFEWAPAHDRSADRRPARVRQPVDLSALVQSVGASIARRLPRPDSVHLDLARGLPEVSGDPSALAEVVLQLVDNAAEATGGAGVVRIRTARAAPSLSGAEPPGGVPQDPCVVLEVADTGEGIDAKHLDRVFEPGFSTRSPMRGRGLATVLRIVTEHQGGIRISSQPGFGTRIRILLPGRGTGSP